jgi:hypothetical protein
MTISEAFEGENSSLRKTFDEAVNTPANECGHEWMCVKEAWHYRDFYCSKCLANITQSDGLWGEIIESPFRKMGDRVHWYKVSKNK